MCNLNVIVVLEFISRDLYLLFVILLSSKFQNSIFYQHMRPKSGLKFPRPLKILPEAPKNESGLTQMIMMGKSIRQIWVKFDCSISVSSILTLPIREMIFNPYLTNGFSHRYQLDESTFIFRGVRSDFEILFSFSMIIQ